MAVTTTGEVPSIGFTVWLTGLPGAGKSTLAGELRNRLRQRGHRVEVLDGDEVRLGLSADLGYSQEDRELNVRRMGFVARLLSRNGVAVLVAAIAPSARVRTEVRRSHDCPFVEVFVDCPLEELQRRDPKGLYRRARNGELADLTGVSAPYDRPVAPDVHLRTDQLSVRACVELILARLQELGLTGPMPSV